MSYYRPVGDIWDSLGAGVKKAVNFYGESQANKGAAELARAGTTAGGGAVVADDSGIPWMPILLVGGVGVAAFVLLKKKK